LALEGVEGLASRLGRTLPPGMTRYALYGRLGLFRLSYIKYATRRHKFGNTDSVFNTPVTF